jgi:NADPH:quinone reductase-like Zn-dependent oxidoreductase
MAKIIEFNRTGAADVLEIREVAVPAPAKDEVQIRVKAFAIHRADLMYRNGQYVIDPVFPAKLGYEAAGIVEAVGEGVDDLVVGDK